MKTIHRVFSLGLLASACGALGGCTAEASRDASGTEATASTRQADSAAYLQTFDPYFQSIVFQPSASTPIDWVILHVTIDGSRTTNATMPETGTSAAAGPAYEIGSLPVLPGDSVVYSFTYSSNGVATDTSQFTYTLPASWTPTVFYTEATASQISAVSTSTLAWADVHYSINGGPQQNVRLTQQGTSYVQPLTLQPSDVLSYSVTYSTGIATFDTATLQYTGTTAAPTPAHYVVDQGTDSATGTCDPSGSSTGTCNLRAAILAAKGAAAAVTIDLSVDSVVNAGEIEIAAGAGAILVECAPGGASHTIAGTSANRLFQVDTGATVTIQNVTVAGFASVASASAIENDGALDLEGVTLAGNATTCSDVGAMTSFATCTGGAVSNSGTLTLGGGTTFANNSVTADSATASFTTAWAGGGAITSSGTITIAGPVAFTGNSANAKANSGYHGEPIGGADASASGGAIYNTGTLTVTAPAGTCAFSQNAATATGSTPQGTTTLTSQGGAIENTGTLNISAGACVFTGNTAQTNPDIDG